jgi:hypothetical protein
MCLYKVTTKRVKTLKPITVWKVITRTSPNPFTAHYSFEFKKRCKLKFDKVLKAESPYLTTFSFVCLSFEEQLSRHDEPQQHYRSGFHSFKYKDGADLWSDGTEVDVVVRCTVPAGSYIQEGTQNGNDVIVSSQIIIHKPEDCHE